MEEKNATNEQPKNKLLTKKDIIGIIIMISITILIRTFIFETAIVEGASMENTIHDGDRVGYYKLTEPHKGDVAIIDAGENVLIKRIIATEGDTIEIKEGNVYVNKKLIKETYIKEKQRPDVVAEITLKENEFFAMGDNRNNSSDSRVYGVFNEKDHYKGHVMFKFKFFNMFKTL